MIGILRDYHAGDSRLGWHATFYQAGFGGCLRRHVIQPFADIFTNAVALGSTAAGDVWCDHVLTARQVSWQNATSFG